MHVLEPAPPRLPQCKTAETTDALRARHRAFHRKTARLARLCRDAGAANDRDLAAIVSTAHLDIRRVLQEAQKELAALVAIRPPDPPPIELAVESESLRQIRRDIQALLDEAQASERIAPPEITTEPTGDTVAPLAVRDDPSSRPVPRVSDAASVLFREHSAPPRSLATRLRVAAAIGGAIVIAGAGTWFALSRQSSGAPGDAPPPTRAAESTARTGGAVPATPAASVAPPSPAERFPRNRSTPLTLWLRVEARRATRIRSAVDGAAAENRLMEAGETRRLLAASSVLLVADDAGAVSVSFNGSPATVLGRDGQVATRRYTLENAPRMPERRAVPFERTSAFGAPAALGAAAAPPLASAVRAGSDTALNRVEPERSELDAESRTRIVGWGQQWLEAYDRRDKSTMGLIAVAGGAEVRDERPPTARLPEGVVSVVRTFTDARMERRGETAILQASMTETASDGVLELRLVSEVAQVWRRSGGRWQLAQVRIARATR